ncbi:MAG: V-type ATPase subunit [Brevinema sp.]
MSWGYLSGLLRSERVHTLTENQIFSLAETHDADSLMKALEDTKYGELFQGHALKEFSSLFDQAYNQKFEEIKNLIPDATIVNLYRLKTDLNNLKICLKAKRSNKNVEWEKLSELGTIAPEHMYLIIDQGLYNELPRPVAEALIEVEQNSQISVRSVDFLVDKAYYQHRLNILQVAHAKNPELYAQVLDLYKKEIDCENIKNFFRAFKMNLDKQKIEEIMIPGGYITAGFFADQTNLSLDDVSDLMMSTAYADALHDGIQNWSETKSCTILEKKIDEYLLDQVQNLSFVISGPAVVEEALRILSLEIKNLKLIIIGKLNNMSVQEIKGRVRDVRA